MTPDGPGPGEDELHAYVDGRLAALDARRVERFLEQHPEAAERVRGWRRDADVLRRVLAAKVREPVPSRLDLARLARRRPARGTWPLGMAASVVVALLAGGIGGWTLRGAGRLTGLAGLAQQAAMGERALATDAGASCLGAARLPVGSGTGGARVIDAPDLSGAGFQLVGGCLVATEQGSAPLFTYRNGHGERVSLLVRLMIGIDTDAAVRSVDAGSVTGFAWSRHGIGFGLVAAPAVPGLRDLSDRVRREMEARI